MQQLNRSTEALPTAVPDRGPLSPASVTYRRRRIKRRGRRNSNPPHCAFIVERKIRQAVSGRLLIGGEVAGIDQSQLVGHGDCLVKFVRAVR